MSEREEDEVAVDTGTGTKRKWRFPGEPKDGTSPQMQSWIDAGQDVRNFFGGVGNFFGDVGGFFGGIRDNFNRNRDAVRNYDPNPVGSLTPEQQQRIEGIIAGTGTRAFQDPLGLRGLFGGFDIPFGGGPSTQTIRATPDGNQFDILSASLGLEQQAVQEPASQTFQDWLMANTGTFDETPYRNYMNFLSEQDEETMARINAMYAQLAGEAEANMQRISDIYGSAQATSGDVFGGSAQNIEDAYASASQQAADQMARLGVEAAAPAVFNPMALSQAEAVSGIEREGASALDALMRYGTTAQDFGSQMAQVGQQQGLEVTASIMRDIQRRQAEAMFQMEQARANFDPYSEAMQRMQMEQAWNQMQNPQMDWRQQQAMADFESKLEGRDLSTWESYYSRNLTEENGDQEKALARTVWEASMGMLGPGIQQQVLNDPELAQYLQ